MKFKLNSLNWQTVYRITYYIIVLMNTFHFCAFGLKMLFQWNRWSSMIRLIWNIFHIFFFFFHTENEIFFLIDYFHSNCLILWIQLIAKMRRFNFILNELNDHSSENEFDFLFIYIDLFSISTGRRPVASPAIKINDKIKWSKKNLINLKERKQQRSCRWPRILHVQKSNYHL